MPEAHPNPPASPAAQTTAAALSVRLELVRGAGKPVELEVSEGFVIGSVPGCDLRLSGTGLPPLICLIVPAADGANLRKLAPTFPFRVNGQPFTGTSLRPNDRLALGSAELIVRVAGSVAGTEQRTAVESSAQAIERGKTLDERARQLAEEQRDLATLRQQHYDQYQQRRDRLAGMKEALAQATRKLQERKRQFDVETAAAAESRKAEVETSTLAAQRLQELEARQRSLDEQQQALALDRAEVERREQHLREERAALEREQAQYQEDLVRFDRSRAALELREQQCQDRQKQCDEREEQLQRDRQIAEERSRQLQELQARLEQQQAKQDLVTSQLAERVAGLESQQQNLTALQTRLERLREELRTREQLLAEERARHQLSVEELTRDRQDLQKLMVDLDRERTHLAQDRRSLEEQTAHLRTEIEQYRPQRETLAAEEQRVGRRAADLDAQERRQTEQDELLKRRSAQLLEMHERLTSDRQSLREREASLLRAEQAREALQEQLRKRSEELAERQKSVAEQSRQRLEEVTALETRRVEMEREHVETRERLAALQQQLENRTNELTALERDITLRRAELVHRFEKLKEVGRSAARARKGFVLRRDEWRAHQHTEEATLSQARQELDELRAALKKDQEQLPELELRAHAVTESLAGVRAQLLAHLEELHTFAQQRQEDLEGLRRQLQEEAERIRLQALAVQRARDEHRLAVAGFRQQLITWQGQVADLKRALAHDETRLERKQAQVDEAVRAVDATSARLAQQAEELQEQEREVAVRRDEVDRHLADMREWYRRKLRELAAGTLAAVPAAVQPAGNEEAVTPHSILSLTAEVDPGDHQLGELLRSLELVDADTLTALLVEARRQRRTLRQVLLASGHVTLYQLALIEAGNLDKLMLGPVRVVDRLRITSLEAIYRVFDPRRNPEQAAQAFAILRHLCEAVMEDAVRPDEYRQRFAAAAAIQHRHVAATWEVLEIAGRPAVLQEWVHGLSAADWADLVAVPGICYRLLCQAALGLQAAHQAGLVHGHLQAGSFVLTGDGTLKLCGLGEPAWLSEEEDAAAPHAAEVGDDLLVLGNLAQAWLAPAPKPKLARTRNAGKVLFELVERLSSADPQARHPTAAALLEDLDRIGGEVPPNTEAWDRLLRLVRDSDDGGNILRRSA